MHDLRLLSQEHAVRYIYPVVVRATSSDACQSDYSDGQYCDYRMYRGVDCI